MAAIFGVLKIILKFIIGCRFPEHILRSYFRTSHISKFSLSFISYAGLGIYSTISSYAGCNKFLCSEMFGQYLILHVEYALLVTEKF